MIAFRCTKKIISRVIVYSCIKCKELNIVSEYFKPLLTLNAVHGQKQRKRFAERIRPFQNIILFAERRIAHKNIPVFRLKMEEILSVT